MNELQQPETGLITSVGSPSAAVVIDQPANGLHQIEEPSVTNELRIEMQADAVIACAAEEEAGFNITSTDTAESLLREFVAIMDSVGPFAMVNEYDQRELEALAKRAKAILN